jgi:hypothetical protein
VRLPTDTEEAAGRVVPDRERRCEDVRDLVEDGERQRRHVGDVMSYVNDVQSMHATAVVTAPASPGCLALT